MGDLKYCFEQQYIQKTLEKTTKNGLAVIDSDGISKSIIQKAVNRGIFVYDYLNVGALEKERSYYKKFKELRLAPYNGWDGQYWIDITSPKWKQHLLQQAKIKKDKGCIGLYLDNTDIYYMCLQGFKEQKSKMIKSAPSANQVYKALVDIIHSIVDETGLIIMPNGGDVFVRKFFKEESDAKKYIKTINQESVLYIDNKKQSKSDTKYLTEYLNWARHIGLYIRGIQYTKNKTAAIKCKAYYKLHGWNGLYISKHKDLKGD